MNVWQNVIVMALTSVALIACSTTPNTTGERLRTWEYDLHQYQPPCHVVTTKHPSGAILGQVTQCPNPQYYCTLKSTGSRIKCPKFNKQHFDEDYSMLKDTHYKEDCRLVYEYNYTHNLDKPKNHWQTVIFPDKNPYCNQYGEPK